MIRWLGGLPRVPLFVGMFLALASVTAAAELADAQRQFLSGNYGGCIAQAEAALRIGADNEDWQLLLSQALLATGRYPEANRAMTNALAQNPMSLRLRWQAREVFLSNGRTEAAAEVSREIIALVDQAARFGRRGYNYRGAPNLVVLGRAALLQGADPKRVLDGAFDAAKKVDPKLRDAYLAGGQLALDKHDYQRAAEIFREGLEQLPDDPDLHCGLAQAYAPGDAALMVASAEAALERNSNHVGSLLLLADHLIDAEEYAEADKLLDRIQTVNPWHPDAWAYRAVLAHLRNQPLAETTARQTALKFWPANPRVEHLIGLKLSQKYLFAEGSTHQRQSLRFNADYLPAKAQLAQDLLRLGEEAEGWKLATEVQEQDGYDVEAYNLVTLRETMGKLATLTNQDFVLRMDSQEAALYGQPVLALLGQARRNLCARFGLELRQPTLVEMFPRQSDFAVRTFGMPGNPGYLGVCFGSVITATSPAAHPGHPVNWQAVLWHEFCHVVTLQLTRNKMPRWLSEGISVYEESQANPTWGQHMTPGYREMILGDELTPVSKLSAAFLVPRSEQHLQFAYYESSLVVEFLVQRFGLNSLQAILRDLGDGADINRTIEKHTEPMPKFENEFTAFARERAEQLAPGLDWAKPDAGLERVSRRSAGRSGSSPVPRSPPTPASTNAFRLTSLLTPDEAWTAWARSHPTNFWVMTRRAQQLVDAKRWAEAKPALQRLVELCPSYTGPDSAYRMLAAAHRALGETNAERQVLAQFAERDDEATDAYLRLMELAVVAQEWPAVAQNAQRYLAVDPLVAPPYRFLARASEQLGDSRTAIGAYRALLQLDPPDPAEVHFRLAEALHHAGDPEARRQVLQALEEAPRYRAALRLLLEMNGQSLQPTSPPPTSNPAHPSS